MADRRCQVCGGEWAVLTFYYAISAVLIFAHGRLLGSDTLCGRCHTWGRQNGEARRG